MSSINTWPGGYEAWNARNYPGTRQLCDYCGEPTGRCEEDAIYVGDDGPLCFDCATKAKESTP